MSGTTGDILSLIQEDCPDYHPILAMARIANDTSTDAGLKVVIHRELANYVFPKLKAVEHTGKVEGGGVTRIDVHFTEPVSATAEWIQNAIKDHGEQSTLGGGG